MKIDPVTYEVDPSGGLSPVYVWEAPVRVWHWLMAVCMFTMFVTGFLIGMPMHANHSPTWMTYDFGYIRMVHFIAGLVFSALFVYRVFWAIFGNRYAHMIFLPPFWSLKWWKGVFGQIAYYLFIKKSAPEYAGHNPLAQAAMFGFFVCGSVGIIITGLALFAQGWGWDSSWMIYFGWVIDLFGDSQAVRTTHHVLMYVFGLFTIAHLYMSVREDVMGGATQWSAMTSGLRLFKHQGGEHH